MCDVHTGLTISNRKEIHSSELLLLACNNGVMPFGAMWFTLTPVFIKLQQKSFFFFFFFFYKNLIVGHMSICGATDTPVLELHVSSGNLFLKSQSGAVCLIRTGIIIRSLRSPLVRHIWWCIMDSIAASRLPHMRVSAVDNGMPGFELLTSCSAVTRYPLGHGDRH